MSNRIELCAEDVELQGELKNIIVDEKAQVYYVNKIFGKPRGIGRILMILFNIWGILP